MTNRLLPSLLTAAALLVTPGILSEAGAHCQVPCGIYDVPGVLDMMHTD